MKNKELINEEEKNVKLEDIKKDISFIEQRITASCLWLGIASLAIIGIFVLVLTRDNRVTEIESRIEVRECIKLEGSLFCGTDKDYE